MNPFASVVHKKASNGFHDFRCDFLGQVFTRDMAGGKDVGDFGRDKWDGFGVQKELRCSKVNEFAAYLALQFAGELLEGQRGVLANSNLDAIIGTKKFLTNGEKNCPCFLNDSSVAKSLKGSRKIVAMVLLQKVLDQSVKLRWILNHRLQLVHDQVTNAALEITGVSFCLKLFGFDFNSLFIGLLLQLWEGQVFLFLYSQKGQWKRVANSF
jgi:hypothetical protein